MGNGLKRILIDLAGIAGKGELHEAIRSALSFPDYYGANLDALHDMLTEFGEGMQIVLSGAEKMDDAVSGYFEVMKDVFRDAQQEVRDLVVEFADLPEDENGKAKSGRQENGAAGFADAAGAADQAGVGDASGASDGPLVSFRGGWTHQGNVVKALNDRERHISGGRSWSRRRRG